MAAYQAYNPDAFWDDQGQNQSSRSTRLYKDLDLFFGKIYNDDVNRVYDVQAVKRSVRNLVLLNHYEKFFHPEIGSGVRGILFDPMTVLAAFALSEEVELVIENFEPRAQVVSVRAQPNLDANAYEVSLEFYVLNAATELVDLTLILERLR